MKKSMNKWLRHGDEVVVLAGNEKGKAGKVLRRTKERVVVEGVNVRKKHLRRTQDNPQGQIISIEMALHLSNVSACDGAGKPVKLKVRDTDKGRDLFYRDGDKEIVYRTVSKGKCRG